MNKVREGTVWISGERISPPSRGEGKCKGPEAGMYLVYEEGQEPVWLESSDGDKEC